MGKKKIIVLSVLGIVLLGVIFIRGHLKIRRFAMQNKQLERRIEQVKQDNRRLKEEQQRLVNDPIYLEEVARKKLGVAREGEVVYKVVPRQENR